MEDNSDDFGPALEDIDELEYQATQFFSTQQVVQNNDNTKENLQFSSVINTKRVANEIELQPPLKKVPLLENTTISNNIVKNNFNNHVKTHPSVKNIPNLYRILSLVFPLEIIPTNVQFINSLFLELKEYIFDLNEIVFNDIINYLNKNLIHICNYEELYYSTMLILKYLLMVDYNVNNGFYSNIAFFLKNITTKTRNKEVYKLICNLFMHFAFITIEHSYIKPYCLLGTICENFKNFNFDIVTSCNVFLNIAYSCTNCARFLDTCDCNCFIEYFDAFFSLVQNVILNHSRILSSKRLFGMDFCVDLIYECIKQIFSFANLIVNDQGRTRLNVRYQYVILAGAPIVYKFRKMSQKEIQEMDEMLAREPGLETAR